MKKACISSLLAASVLLAPVAAFADGIVQLSPLNQPTTTPSYTTTTPQTTAPLRDETISLRGRISTIPKGTTLMVKLDQPISSFSSNIGDSITATLENDIFANDTLLVPAGSEVLGQVTNASKAGHLGKHGEVEAKFFSIKTPEGAVVPIRGHVVTKDNSGILKGNSFGLDVVRGVGTVVGATGAGAALGVAAGSLIGTVSQGVLFGTAMGGIAGVTYAMMRTGKDVVIPSGARISVVVDQESAVTP